MTEPIKEGSYPHRPETGKWLVQVFGKKCSRSFEISVVREDHHIGRKSWGWFDKNKLLISHNGGPCHWPLKEIVWDKMIRLAEDVANELNEEEGQNDRTEEIQGKRV